ncbi:four-helix bundle copper-binding protein [Methylosinus sp. Sm6]|uniref:four-helix bundle copper-binding protein n=1 Tax=Methylosinus sp. Sm6 TaxID=2866948 RepID=UPI001C998F0B|nr:four-helix bundle copper-binding protein [Methylosinus sp. Sm6]MBY6240149.1 four-helix bundle copper-binding protein [Methylosinus sp. Sm6]
MERRQFVAAIGAAAAATSARAFAQATAPGAPVHHHPAKFRTLMETSAKCVSTGNECLRHCFGMLSMNDASMADCTKASYDLVAACAALETLSAVNSPATPALAKTVYDVCMACKKECDRFPQYVECKNCGDACKACADECQRVSS